MQKIVHTDGKDECLAISPYMCHIRQIVHVVSLYISVDQNP
jgi:hypothetical protein